MTALPWVAESATLPGFVTRATIVLAIGLSLAWLIRRRSAQIRHRLWTATLVILLLLPPLALWAPQWEVPLLPAAPDAAAETDASQPTALPPASRPTTLPPAPSPTASASGPTIAETISPEVPTHSPGPSPSARRAVTEPAGGYTSEPLRPVLLLWATGCLAGLVSLAAGHLRFRALVRGARPLRDPRWLRDMEETGQRLGLRGDVRLLVSGAAGTPMTGGFRNPVILLPASSATWDSERRGVVLMHELVHIRRRDVLRQLMGGIVLALYWFHPLSWLASRLAAISREEACDERVLELGSRPSEYARHLMSLATGTGPGHLPVAALSLARQSPSRLEKRIMAILRPRRPRPSALATAALVMATGSLGVSVAVTNPVHRENPDAIGMSPSPLVSHAVPYEGDPPFESLSLVTSANNVDAEPPALALKTAGPGAPDHAGLQVVPCDPSDRTGTTVVRFAGGQRVRTVIDGVRLCMRIQGDAALAGGKIRSIAADGWIILESEGARLHRLVVRSGSGGFEHEWSVGGESVAFDGPAEEWRDGMLAVLGGHLEISRIRDEGSALEVKAAYLRDVVSGLQGQIINSRGTVQSLQSQISYLQNVVSGLLDQASYSQDIIAALRSEISYHGGVVAGLHGEISLHRSRIVAFQEVKSGYQVNITNLIPRLKISHSGESRQVVERSIKGWEERIRYIDEQIEAYGLDETVRKIEEKIEAYGLDDRVKKLAEQIEAHERDAGIRQLEAEIAEKTSRLNDLTRRVDGEIVTLEARVRNMEEGAGAYGLVEEVAVLGQGTTRDLDADERVKEIERFLVEEGRRLLQLIRQL